MHVGAGFRSGDPPAGAVRGGGAPVERGSELPDHPRTTAGHRERPGVIEVAGLVGQQPSEDRDASRLQPGRTACRPTARIGLPVHDPRHPGVEQRLRTRARTTLVVARLQRDVGRPSRSLLACLGEGLDLGVGPAGAAMEPFSDHAPVAVGDHGADARIRVDRWSESGQFQSATHQRHLVRHRFTSGSALQASSGVWNDGRSRAGPRPWSVDRPCRQAKRRTWPPRTGGPDAALRACCLPSGLSPSVLEFHQVNRPLAADGSRTVTAGSELHRPRSTWAPACHGGRGDGSRGGTSGSSGGSQGRALPIGMLRCDRRPPS